MNALLKVLVSAARITAAVTGVLALTLAAGLWAVAGRGSGASGRAAERSGAKRPDVLWGITHCGFPCPPECRNDRKAPPAGSSKPGASVASRCGSSRRADPKIRRG